MDSYIKLIETEDKVILQLYNFINNNQYNLVNLYNK